MPYLIEEYLSPNNTEGHIPSPDSFLFNDTRAGPTLNFKPGKRYLLRIVSTASVACGDFHIDGHTLTVVAVDGEHVHPQDADTIIICAGQSYDVVVVGQWNPLSSVRYIAKMTTDMLNREIPSNTNLTVIGTLAYNLDGRVLDSIYGGPDPSWTPTAFLDDTTLTPLDDQPLLSCVTKEVKFVTNQTYYEGIGTRIGMGAQPWVAPKVPSLYTALSTGR